MAPTFCYLSHVCRKNERNPASLHPDCSSVLPICLSVISKAAISPSFKNICLKTMNTSIPRSLRERVHKTKIYKGSMFFITELMLSKKEKIINVQQGEILTERAFGNIEPGCGVQIVTHSVLCTVIPSPRWAHLSPLLGTLVIHSS